MLSGKRHVVLTEASKHAAKSASDIACSYFCLRTKSVMLHVAATYKMFEVVVVVVKQLCWLFVVLNAYPNALNEPV